MSNMNDRKGSPRRDFEERPDPSLIFISALMWANPLMLFFAFVISGDWFIGCCSFLSLKLVTLPGVVWR